MRTRLSLAVVLSSLLALFATRVTAAEATDPARLFPESTLVYVELRNPDPLLDYAYNPDLHALVARSDQVKSAIAGGQFAKLNEGIAFLEGKLGVNWQEALRKLIGGGVQLGFDPLSNAPLLAIHARQADMLTKFHAAVVEAIEADHKNRGVPSPIKSEEYRGQKGYSFGHDEAHVIVGDTLLVSNRPEALKRAIDRQLDATGKSLADVAEFQQARKLAGTNPTSWAFFRVEHIRQLPGFDKALESTRENPALELIFGGVLETLKKAPFGAASLEMQTGRATLHVRLPRDPSQVAESRRWHFAPQGGQAATPLRVKGHIATISTYRDLEGLWNAREELFNEQIGRNLTQAEAQLALFFGKQDLGTEVLAELGPRSTIVVAHQEFAAGQPAPAIRLPAFAQVWDLPHPEEMSLDLLSVYQKIVGLANLGGGQQGLPPLLLSTEDYRGVQVSKAVYRIKADAPKENMPIQHNFSPSCARIGNRFVIGSTIGIVRSLVDLFQDQRAGAPGEANTLIELDAQEVSAALELNREWFVSQTMLSEGKSHDTAAEQVGLLLDLVRGAIAGRVRLVDGPQTLDLEVTVGSLP